MSGRIRKIFLKNIGPYKNENEISFQKLKKNDLNIIIGKNSYGKTSLLKSIKWLFYEKESDRLKNENSNRQEMKTEITFEKEGKIINLIRSDFHGSQIYSNESKYIDFHEEVDKMLPNIVSDFFLFEGEFLSNLFEEYEGQKLKESIMKLSKINRINKIISALKKCQENYRHKITKINKKNKKIEKLNKKINLYKKSLKEEKEKEEKNKRLLKNALNQRKKNEKRLIDISKDDSLEELISKRNELEDKIKTKQRRLDKKKNREIKFFFDEVSDVFLHDFIKQFLEISEKKEKEGKYPPNIEPKPLKQTLEEKRCKICGRKIDDNKIKEIKEMLKEVKNANYNRPLYNLSIKFSKVYENFQKKISTFQQNIDEYNDIKNDLNRNKKEIKRTEEKINVSESQQDEFKRLKAKRIELNKEIDQLRNEKNRYRDNIFKINKGLGKYQNDFNKISGKISNSKEYSSRSELAQELINKYKEIMRNIKIELSKSLQKKTEKYYKDIFSDLNRTTEYKIKIDDDFNIKVLSEKNYDRLNENKLSTGEYKILSLSFLLGLSDFYGFDFPIIIDAPFSDLTNELRKKLLDAIIKLSNEKQIILLTLPNIGKQIMQRLMNESNKVYELISPGEINERHT